MKTARFSQILWQFNKLLWLQIEFLTALSSNKLLLRFYLTPLVAMAVSAAISVVFRYKCLLILGIQRRGLL